MTERSGLVVSVALLVATPLEVRTKRRLLAAVLAAQAQPVVPAPVVTALPATEPTPELRAEHSAN